MMSQTLPSTAVPAKPTAGDLARISRRVYHRGSVLLRTLIHYRPYICPFEDLIGFVPQGANVLDVGCGAGLWLTLLHELGRIRRGVGFDLSERALIVARGGARTPGPSAPHFVKLDAGGEWPRGPWDVVSFVDVLHHIPPALQQGVMVHAAGAVAPGGILLYKDMTSRGIIRPLANRMHDLAVAREWIHYAPLERVKQWLQGAGLVLEAEGAANRLWYGHEYVVFRKPGPSPAASTDHHVDLGLIEPRLPRETEAPAAEIEVRSGSRILK